MTGAYFSAAIVARWAASGGKRSSSGIASAPIAFVSTRDIQRHEASGPSGNARAQATADRQLAIKMREQRAAARGLPAQRRAQASASTAANIRSPRPANQRAAVSGACSAVEK